RPWWEPANYDAVAVPVKLFYCPSNRSSGWIDLEPIALQWATPLPPRAAACAYAFCRGASGALPRERNRIPAQVRGVFHVPQHECLVLGVRLTDIADGTSNTFAMRDAAGGTTTYPARDLRTPG